MADKKIRASEVKKMLKEGKVVIGTERTLKSLKKGEVEKVIITDNCDEKILDDIKHYGSLSDVEILRIGLPNEELGIICKKPFAISVLSILKGK